MSESLVYKTLASRSRLQILRLLYRKPLSVEEIAEKLNLQTITIRHHLRALVESGIVEYHEERSGTAGRPKAFYSIVKTPPSTSFPRRQYQLLSEILLNAVVGKFGMNEAKAFLRDMGMRAGEEAVKQIESEHGIKSWSPKEYKKYLVEDYFEKEGAEPEIVEITDNKLVFRLHNCLFHEMAVKMPDIMCDVLHDSVLEGIAKAIGKGSKTRRITCIGHGDPYCEHVCAWASKNK